MRKAININIHEMRIAKNLTLQELAQKVGTSKQTIQRYETGEISNIPYDKIVKIAAALDTTPQNLMGWETIEDVLLRDQEEKMVFELYKKADTQTKEMVKRLLAYEQKIREMEE